MFEKYPLIAAVSEKKDGSMKLFNKPKEENMLNRERFLKKLKIDSSLLVSAGLVHGNVVKVVDHSNAGKVASNADGLITDSKGIFLSVTVADCLPIFLYDPQKEIIALIHAGWKSLAKGILACAVEKMEDEFKSLPKDILASVGPGIGVCHFEVGEEVMDEFREFLPVVRKKKFLNLKKIAELQLMDVGVKEVEISKECTYCLEDKYFSYRRIKEMKAMMAVMGMLQ